MAIDPNGTFLQIAYGGYLLISPSTEVKEELVYSEPGFTTNSPIEFAIPKSDQFYFIIRKRNNIYGTSFDDLSLTNLNVTVVDATIGMSLEANLQNFSSTSTYYDPEWEDGTPDYNKVILAVNSGTPINSPINRVRTIDIKIEDIRDNSILFYRVLADDYNKVFYYIAVDVNLVSQRDSFSTAGSDIIKNLDGKADSYVLLSPFASFYETNKGQHDFAYPLNTIFYKRQITFNEEDFKYQIKNVSHSFLSNNVRVKNIPSYLKMGVIIIDKNLYNEVVPGSSEIYVDIEVLGLISEMRDTFRINFVRA